MCTVIGQFSGLYFSVWLTKFKSLSFAVKMCCEGDFKTYLKCLQTNTENVHKLLEASKRELDAILLDLKWLPFPRA